VQVYGRAECPKGRPVITEVRCERAIHVCVCVCVCVYGEREGKAIGFKPYTPHVVQVYSKRTHSIVREHILSYTLSYTPHVMQIGPHKRAICAGL
jgi:hypothetical protein